MATVTKDFKIKYGLIVEGTTATVNGYDILTKNPNDDQHIIDLIGGEATSANTPLTVVKRDASGNFAAGTITADITGNVSGSAGTVDSLSGHNTDDLSEGSSNKYYSDSLVDSHLSGGDGINYSSGTISADLGTGLNISAGAIAIDRTTVDTWYDESGAAADVASDLSTHTGSSSAHGVTGNIVGTSDTQTLSNKTFSDALNFTGAGAMTINSDADVVLTPASGSSVKWGSDILATQSYADSAAGDVASDLSTHEGLSSAHGVTGDIVGTTDAQTLSNKTLGSDLAAAGYKVSGLADPTADQEAATKKYVDDEIAGLIDGAPAILDTLNELAAALGDDADVVTGLATSIGNKVLKAGDSMSGNLDFGGTNKVTGLATPTSTTDAATKDYVDGEINTLDSTAEGYVSTHAGLTSTHGVTGTIVGTSDSQTLTNKTIDASSNTLSNIANSSLTNSSITVNGYSTDLGSSVTLDTDDISEGTNEYYTAQKVKDVLTSSSQSNISITDVAGVLTITAENGVAESDTDDLTEGTINKYFTDDRAKDAAGYLLENATQSNISITYDEFARTLTVTAEDGFDGHDTDDLGEGTSNLYFSDARAQSAVDGTTRSFTSINLDTYRTEEATQQYVSTASTVTAHTFTGNKSAKYLVRTVGMISGTLHSQVSEVLVTVDGANNVAVTEYGTIHTSENPLSTVTADYAGGEYRLRVTTAIVNAEVIVAATTMSWAD
jgi:hypothetical protein